MRTRVTVRKIGVFAVLFWVPALLNAETLVLKRAWLEKYKKTVTMTVNLEVDTHLNTPHRISSGGDDGDIHMAGRAPEIQLPLVAEILNARMEPQAMSLLKQSTSSHPVSVTGVWRLWFEHLGKADQVQGNPVAVPSDSNPAHLFEIHPITVFDGEGVVDKTLVPIPGYTAYDAKKAFSFYEDNPATISASSSGISIAAGRGMYNYAEFVIEPVGIPQARDGGFVVLAKVLSSDDAEEEVASDVRRMVFVDKSDAANQLAKLPKGNRLHVLGIPRVSLEEVSAIVQKSGANEFSGNLPYEMIIVAVLD